MQEGSVVRGPGWESGACDEDATVRHSDGGSGANRDNDGYTGSAESDGSNGDNGGTASVPD